ncbi:MAG: response regulator [Bacteroidales bacterium]|nr:MAG: response regulator [Bacteroidales bacterium]
MTLEKKLIFLVDDDALYLKFLEIEFSENNQYEIKTFATGELCLENMSLNPDIVVLDYHLNGVDESAINGLQTLDLIKKENFQVSVIILSSQDKIEVAVNCMKHKAFDYIVKSETAPLRLQKAIATIFKNQELEKTLKWYMEMM